MSSAVKNVKNFPVNANAEKSLPVEQSVLGAVFLLGDPSVSSDSLNWLFSFLKPESFYSVSHRTIFEAMRTLHRTQRPIDLITIDDALTKSNNIDLAGGFVYLANLANDTPSAANLKTYASLVREYSIERYATGKLNEGLAMITDGSEGDIYSRLGMLNTLVNDILGKGLRNESKGLRHIGDYLNEWVDAWDERIQNDNVDVNALSTGLAGLDDLLGAKLLRRGSLVAIGARPKMGKTALLVKLALHFSITLEKNIAFFSLEMPGVEIAERSISTDANIDSNVFYDKRGVLEETMGKTYESVARLNNSNFFLDDTPGITLAYLQREARKIHNKKPIDMLCVDYLTLMEGEQADRNDLAYGKITKALKNLAKEFNCVVVLLTQLNRGLEQRADKRPLPSDSRDTGQIEQDCDVWIGMYREGAYDDSIYRPELTELIVRLNRHGATGTTFCELTKGTVVDIAADEVPKIMQQREPVKTSKRRPFKGYAHKEIIDD